MTSDEGPSSGKRVSITKSQRETELGAELLSICQTTTSDGSLTDEEVLSLREWLKEHASTDLPAIAFLVPIVERILSDGVISADENRELFLAIEKILPQDIREMSRTARRGLEKGQKESERLAARDAAQKVREEKQRNRPVARFDFMVAGTRYEGRPRLIEQHVEEGDEISLERDAGNRHSRNAVGVWTTSGHHIGFVPEDDAVELAALLDSGHSVSARVKKMLSGGRNLIPVVVADAYQVGVAPNSQARPSQSSSYRAQVPSSSRSLLARPIVWIVLAIVAVVVVRSCS